MANNQTSQAQPQGQVQPVQQKREYSFKTFNDSITLPQTQEYLTKILGTKKGSFVNNVTALVSNNAQLQKCEPLGVMYAAIKATALNLPLDSNLGFAYVIPFWNSKSQTFEAQFQLGYRGFIQLAIRSGQFKTINVRDVREGEIVDEDFITGELTFKKRDHRDELPIVGYVAFFELVNGFRKMSYWTIEEINQHGLKYSQTYANERSRAYSKWATDFDAMAKKTCLKLLLAKFAPMSVEMEQAVISDQAVINRNLGVDSYIDNEESLNASTDTAEQQTQDICEGIMAKMGE